MAQGPGKYDADAKKILLRDKAVAVAMIVIGGVRNGGSAMKVAIPHGAPEETALETIRYMATLFRAIADEIEKDAADPTLKADK